VVVPACTYETKPLREARRRLPLSEYCWTCKPAILQHAVKSISDLEWAIWLDSDMLAFGDIGSALSLHSGASVVLTPHRFSLPEFGFMSRVSGISMQDLLPFTMCEKVWKH